MKIRDIIRYFFGRAASTYTKEEALQEWDIYPYTEEQYKEWIKEPNNNRV